MEAGNPAEAEDVFTWAQRIGERTVGGDSPQIMNIYRFLAAAYYQQGKYEAASASAGKLLEIAIDAYGPRSPQAREAKGFLKKITIK